MMEASHGEAPSEGPPGVVVHLDTNLSAIEDGRVAVLEYLTPFALDAQVINRLEVVLEELVSNVVLHNADAHSLTIEADCCSDGVHLTVVDNGSAFDPLEVTTPAPFTTLEEAKVGGLGIPLIRRFTRDLRYERVDARNRISVLIPLS